MGSVNHPQTVRGPGSGVRGPGSGVRGPGFTVELPPSRPHRGTVETPPSRSYRGTVEPTVGAWNSHRGDKCPTVET